MGIRGLTSALTRSANLVKYASRFAVLAARFGASPISPRREIDSSSGDDVLSALPPEISTKSSKSA